MLTVSANKRVFTPAAATLLCMHVEFDSKGAQNANIAKICIANYKNI